MRILADCLIAVGIVGSAVFVKAWATGTLPPAEPLPWGTIVQAGGMNLVVTPKNVYNTCAELVKNANLKTPDMFFTDPGDKLAPPPSDDAQKLQAQQQALEQRRQQLDAVDAQLKDKKIQLQAQEAQQNAAQTQQETQLRHMHEMIDLKLKHEAQSDKVTVEMEKIRNALTEMELKYATNIPGARV
jgi:hypothetical protein